MGGPLVSAEIVRSRFEIVYVGADGTQCREPLTQGWRVPFEDAPPVRSFPSVKDQRHFPGYRWSASTGMWVTSRFWNATTPCSSTSIRPCSPTRRSRSPCAGATGGASAGIPGTSSRGWPTARAWWWTCVPDERVGDRDAEAFAVTAQACEQVGWVFRRVGVPDAVWTANVRWRAGYRAPRCHRPDVAARPAAVFATPTPLFVGVEEVGPPIAVLPVAYHLLWRHVLVADLRSALLGRTTIVGVGAREGWA